MDKALLKTLLSSEFYQANKTKMRQSLFTGHNVEVFKTIAQAQDKYEQDITTNDILAIWTTNHPVATKAEREDFTDLLTEVRQQEALTPVIAKDVIGDLWRKETGRDITNLGIQLAEGHMDAMGKLKSLIERTSEDYLPDDYGEPTTDDLYELLAQASDEARWKFNINQLSRHVYGVGPSEFMVIFARPETGKSALAVSLCAAPDGFCQQGAKVLYIGNEEATRRTKLRAIQSFTGMNTLAIKDNPDLASSRYLAIRDRLIMKDAQEWDMEMLDGYVTRIKPDILVVDQLCKINISGQFGGTHEKLREIYRQARELAKRHECAIIAVSQASAEAEGRTRLDFSMMENSRTGKAAEADLICGIGKTSGEDENGPDPTRFLQISKNKLSGWHGQVVCNLNADITRYVD
jgi:replicative DNA helicase